MSGTLWTGNHVAYLKTAPQESVWIRTGKQVVRTQVEGSIRVLNLKF